MVCGCQALHGGEQRAVGQAVLIVLLCWLVAHADAPRRVQRQAPTKFGGDNRQSDAMRRPINGSAKSRGTAAVFSVSRSGRADRLVCEFYRQRLGRSHLPRRPDRGFNTLQGAFKFASRGLT